MQTRVSVIEPCVGIAPVESETRRACFVVRPRGRQPLPSKTLNTARNTPSFGDLRECASFCGRAAKV